MSLHESALEAAADAIDDDDVYDVATGSATEHEAARTAIARKVVSAYQAALRVTTRNELDALPIGAVVQSDAGTIACRHDLFHGVVFGYDQPFPWSIITLPALVLHVPEVTP